MGPEVGFSGIKPNPQWGTVRDFKSPPPARRVFPAGGERIVHLVAGGILKTEETVNTLKSGDLTTQQLGSSRATKWRGSVSWREVSTGGVNLVIPRKLRSLAVRII